MTLGAAPVAPGHRRRDMSALLEPALAMAGAYGTAAIFVEYRLV
jgi:hypothetical protein